MIFNYLAALSLVAALPLGAVSGHDASSLIRVYESSNCNENGNWQDIIASHLRNDHIAKAKSLRVSTHYVSSRNEYVDADVFSTDAPCIELSSGNSRKPSLFEGFSLLAGGANNDEDVDAYLGSGISKRFLLDDNEEADDEWADFAVPKTKSDEKRKRMLPESEDPNVESDDEMRKRMLPESEDPNVESDDEMRKRMLPESEDPNVESEDEMRKRMLPESEDPNVESDDEMRKRMLPESEDPNVESDDEMRK